MATPDLTITFLGTGTSGGVPMIACPCEVCASTNKKDKRLRSSILVKSATTSFVVDTTPDFRYQMLRDNVQNLDAVLFTHHHKDHIAGLDDIRAYNYFQKKPMEIYATVLTQEALRKEFSYAFHEKKYPGIPEMNIITIDLEPFVIGDIPVTPILVWHHLMPVHGYRFGKFTYVTDANRIDTDEMEKIKGSDIMVINALRKEKHVSHFTLGEAIELIHELKVPKAYLTHISHQLGLHNEVSKELPAGIELAYDQLTIDI